MCNEVRKGIALILDLTWTGWGRCRQLAESAGIPYIRADVTIGGFVQVVDAYLTERKGSDAALIFQNEEGTYECAPVRQLSPTIRNRLIPLLSGHDAHIRSRELLKVATTSMSVIIPLYL